MLAYQYEPDGKMRLVTRETPTARDGELTLDVVASGVCGTDLKIARGQHRMFPRGTTRVPGHEIIGKVRENNSSNAISAGTLVAVAPNIGCGYCGSCLGRRSNLCKNYESVGLTMDGGFAEVVRIPARAIEQGNLMPIEESVAGVAVLTEPVAAVARGIRSLAPSNADTLLVCGAGPIGLIAVMMARQLGVARIIVSQTSQARRELAKHWGADDTINPRAEDLVAAVMRLTGGRGADCVIVATPVAEVFQQSLSAASDGGRVNFFAGLPAGEGVVALDANLIHYRELMVTGSTANTTADCEHALALLVENPVPYGELITHRMALADSPRAFEIAVSGEALKMVIQP